MTDTPTFDALKKLREPFPANQISKLPKPTKAQTDEVKADFRKGIRCQQCGAWHHPDVAHLDYVGHAALTDRLLDTDPVWSWEPLALRDGLPAFDQSGGLWIKLTVCGVSRIGYGHAAAKQGQDPGAREKEVIGDALRNAAMRFGAALDLWHKGDLHGDDDDGKEPAKPAQKPVQPKQEKPKADNPFDEPATPAGDPDAVVDDLCERIRVCRTGDDLDALRSAPEFLSAFKSLPPSHKSMIREAGKAREQGIAAGN